MTDLLCYSFVRAQNIMDLIPPPMPTVSGSISAVTAPTSELMTSTAGTPAGTPAVAVAAGAIPMPASLSMPLAPPPDLMMRALSPPTSLLPELVQPPAISLASSAAEPVKTEGTMATAAINGAASTATSTLIDPPSHTLKPAVTSAAAAAAAATAATNAALGHVALLKKVR